MWERGSISISKEERKKRKMGFLGVYTAIYDYVPQADGELEIKEGDLLYLLEKSGEGGWWKAKKKAERDDEDEPEGLVPNNYIEEVRRSLFLSMAMFRSLLCWKILRVVVAISL